MKKLLLLRNSQSGMTLVEVLVVTMIVGILATLAVPNWFNFIKQQELNKVTETLELLLRQVQNQAKRENVAYTLQFQLNEEQLQYKRIKGSQNPDAVYWQPVVDQPLNMTFPFSQGNKIIFNHDGTINTDGGDDYLKVDEKIVMSIPNLNPTPKRCVIIQTLLGAIDTGKNDECNE